jgi:hypothetical protein
MGKGEFRGNYVGKPYNSKVLNVSMEASKYGK